MTASSFLMMSVVRPLSAVKSFDPRLFTLPMSSVAIAVSPANMLVESDPFEAVPTRFGNSAVVSDVQYAKVFVVPSRVSFVRSRAYNAVHWKKP